MLKFIKGNLLDAPQNIILHSVNCRGAFGSGVAGQIAKRFPVARSGYMSKFKKSGWHLGDVQYCLVEVTQPKWIVNCATQDDFGTDKVQVDYLAVAQCLEKVFSYAVKDNLTVAMPRIGCGLAGGTWNLVKSILVAVLTKYDVDVTIYELEA